MDNYLIFQLYAPMTSWGQAAVGEARHTGFLPSRSALLGLLAAALGIKREQEQQIDHFNQHYQFAVRPFIKQARWLMDYHTSQTPPESKKLHYQTRRDELTFDRLALETILSSREYQCDAYYHVLLRATDDAPYSLTAIKQALEQPVFPLYLGRKSCPLALPLAPSIVSGSLVEAFAQAESYLDVFEKEQLFTIFQQQPFFKRQEAAIYYWQQDDDTDGLIKQKTQQLADNPLSRRRWQFGNRLQHSGILAGGH